MGDLPGWITFPLSVFLTVFAVGLAVLLVGWLASVVDGIKR